MTNEILNKLVETGNINSYKMTECGCIIEFISGITVEFYAAEGCSYGSIGVAIEELAPGGISNED